MRTNTFFHGVAERLKAGVGSQRKDKVLVMAENSSVEMPKREKR